jgi:hypothetical protein
MLLGMVHPKVLRVVSLASRFGIHHLFLTKIISFLLSPRLWPVRMDKHKTKSARTKGAEVW